MSRIKQMDVTNKNVIEIESLDFGEFTVILDDDQVHDLLERGAKILLDFREDVENNLEDVEDKEDWYISDNFGLRDEDAFGSGGIDWNSIFPEIDSSDFEGAINSVLAYSRNTIAPTVEVLTILGVGIASAMGASGGPSALGVVSVCGVSGPFFDAS